MDSQELQEITNDSQKALEFAKAYKKEGKYEQALEMHEWYRLNALSDRPSLYTDKLSSALAHWVELARIYPKAKQRLIEIRDDEIKKIKKGNWKFGEFYDIRTISKELKDDETPIEIFKLICEKETDKEKVNKCFAVVLEYLVNKSEKEICHKYLGESEGYVKKYINEFKENERAGNDHINKMVNHEKKEQVIQGIIQVRKNIFINHMRLLVRVLKLVNRDKEIEEVFKAGEGVIPDEEYQKIFELK